MRKATNRLKPDMILGFEGAQEFYLQDVGIQDYRDFEVLWKDEQPARVPAPVFAYGRQGRQDRQQRRTGLRQG